MPKLPSLKERSVQKRILTAKVSLPAAQDHVLSQLLDSPQATAARSSQSVPDQDATMASEPTLSSLAQLAESSAAAAAVAEFTEPSGDGEGAIKTAEQSRRHYLKTLHKVIDQSDIVVLVLDARDPEGCRSKLVEEEVRRREAEGKKLVFVLNKVGAYL